MKKLLYPAVGIVFILALFLLLRTDKTPVTTSNGNSNSSGSEQNPADSGTSETQLRGKYQTYSETSLNQNRDKKRILYFYANWCPTCRPVNEELNRSEDQIPDNIVIIRVNYNDSDTDEDEENLAKKYGVTYQHTFVQIDENDQVVTQWNGGGLTELLANIK